MRILAGIGMLNHSAQRLCFQHDPSAVAFFEVVRYMHAGARRAAILRAKLHLCVRLVAVDPF